VKYYIQRHGKIEGPLTVDEINARLASGVIDSNWRATSDLGGSRDNVLRTPERDWVPIGSIPGIRGVSQTSASDQKNEARYAQIGLVILLILIGFALLFGFLRFQRMFNW
jgi:hypothetical protein